ncbi:TetR/AcrR family transcriptional regulator [Acinetobacter sp. BHS4]|uniref:TetR/AcrR family transcriptional regulator n=1 Tax=Acinetobacter sp. BHS4 TaxID=2836181 RepID=UPI001BCE2B66|nr:TetR/AcrR family transcriptional regulator [Acinetobacter sp. BHS4]QVR69610.1 TetR/AcrR family transcriptional regulator [Acinetobacter sp. BHS4]
MPKIVLPTRAVQVVNKSIELFHYNGFHLVGIDRLVKECEVTKATFYNYFHSKERLIEICLIVQKERLKEKVISVVAYDHSTNAIDKLKKLYLLHADLDGLYYLLFKAIFETKLTHPKAYITAVRYRTWLTNEIYSLLRTLNSDASFTDAKLFLYMIEGAIIQGLSLGELDERVVEVFLKSLSIC